MSLEQEAKAAAEAEYPIDLWTSAREAKPMRVPYAHGYQAGRTAPITDLEVDAAARALNPEAWNVYDDPRAAERDMIVEGSRTAARAALEAARAAR